MTKKLYTNYNEYSNTFYTGKFEIIEKIPEVGDYWNGMGCEVIAVEPVKLDDIQNERSFGAKFEAYKVSHINCGCDEEREDPFVDYVAIEHDLFGEEGLDD